VLSLFPFASVIYVAASYDLIFVEKRNMLRFSALFEGLKPDSLGTLMYNILIAMRKYIYAFLVVYLEAHPFAVIIYLCQAHILLFMYLVYLFPFMDRQQNTLEIMNALTILGCCYISLGLTEHVTDIQFKENLGWALIGLFVGNAVINLSVCSFNELKALIIKCRNRKKI